MTIDELNYSFPLNETLKLAFDSYLSDPLFILNVLSDFNSTLSTVQHLSIFPLPQGFSENVDLFLHYFSLIMVSQNVDLRLQNLMSLIWNSLHNLLGFDWVYHSVMSILTLHNNVTTVNIDAIFREPLIYIRTLLHFTKSHFSDPYTRIIRCLVTQILFYSIQYYMRLDQLTNDNGTSIQSEKIATSTKPNVAPDTVSLNEAKSSKNSESLVNSPKSRKKAKPEVPARDKLNDIPELMKKETAPINLSHAAQGSDGCITDAIVMKRLQNCMKHGQQRIADLSMSSWNSTHISQSMHILIQKQTQSVAFALKNLSIE